MKWWAEYDLDGAFEFHRCADGVEPTAWAHLIGPFNTFTEAKKALLGQMTFCIRELQGAKTEIKRQKKFGIAKGKNERASRKPRRPLEVLRLRKNF